MGSSRYQLTLFWLLFLASISATAREIDWNDDELVWYEYTEGMQTIKNNKKTGLLIFYADWCSVCKEYSQLFKNPKVVQHLENTVLIRVNRDENIKLSEAYDFDGVYIPRTFAIGTAGDVVKTMYDDTEQYAFFLPPDDPDFIIKFIDLLNKNP